MMYSSNLQLPPLSFYSKRARIANRSCEAWSQTRPGDFFRRPPTSAPAALETCNPAIYFRCSEQASIAVAAVGILAELARTIYRHRAAAQRQARCFAQQIRPSRSLHCRRTTRDAGRDLDRAKVAAFVRPLKFGDWREVFRAVLARNRAKQPFQYSDHGGIPVIDSSSIGFVNTRVLCPSICIFPAPCRTFRTTVDLEQCHKQAVIADTHVCALRCMPHSTPL
jgi:hypothetical protein